MILWPWWDNAGNTEFAVDNGTAQIGSSGSSATVNGLNLASVGGGSPSNFANISIAEIFVASSKVSGADRTNLINYFNTRYGLSL